MTTYWQSTETNWGLMRDAVLEAMCTEVLRLIGTDLRYRGLSSRELEGWGQLAWPHLEHLEPVQAIARHLDERLYHPGELSRPLQLIWTLPQDAPKDYVLEPHIDVPPPGREFSLIAGVAFSRWTMDNGTVRVWEHGPQGIPCAITLEPGDVVMMRPDLPHSPGINRSGEIRTGLYCRWLQPKED